MERGRERVNRLPTCYLGLAGNLQPARLGVRWGPERAGARGRQSPEGLEPIEEQGYE